MKTKKIVDRCAISREIVRYTDAGGRSVVEVEGVVEITIDVEWLARRLGFKALYAKTGKASIQGGAVRVAVVERREKTKTEAPQ